MRISIVDEHEANRCNTQEQMAQSNHRARETVVVLMGVKHIANTQTMNAHTS